jgi:hypothetical protein
MCATLEPGRLDGFDSYPVFKSLFVIGWFPVNKNIVATKLGALPIPPPELCDFLEKGSNDFNYISVT